MTLLLRLASLSKKAIKGGFSMRVFITGATGHIGSLVVAELLTAGHEVLGLARSDKSAAALTAAGAEVHRGALNDLDSLRAAVAAADGVIHLAFIHDFSNYAAACATDLRAVETIGELLVGTDTPFVATSGTAGVKPRPLRPKEDIQGGESPRGPAEDTPIPAAHPPGRASA